MTPCILLAGRGNDAELMAIASMLRRLNVCHVRLDIDRLGDDSIGLDAATGALTINGEAILPTVSWPRHLTSLPIGGDHGAFLRESWVSLVDQLAVSAHRCFPGRAPATLGQLEAAGQLGIRVPSTVVTTDCRSAPTTWERVVVKALHRHYVDSPDGSLEWYLPEVVDRGRAASWARPGLPVVLQEYVAHEAELRVYFVDGAIIAFGVEKDRPADVWLAPDRVVVRVEQPSPAVAAATASLSAAWGLSYGAFDFLISGGVPVFLEVNVDGDWRWFEGRADSNLVTTATTTALIRRHRTAPAHGSRTRLDIMTFLTG